MSSKLRLCANCNNYHCDNFVPVVESTVLTPSKPIPLKLNDTILSTSHKDSTNTKTDYLTLKKLDEISNEINNKDYTPLKFVGIEKEKHLSNLNTTNPSISTHNDGAGFGYNGRYTMDIDNVKETTTERINNLLAQSSSKLVLPSYSNDTKIKNYQQQQSGYDNRDVSNILGKALNQHMNSNYQQMRTFEPISTVPYPFNQSLNSSLVSPSLSFVPTSFRPSIVRTISNSFVANNVVTPVSYTPVYYIPQGISVPQNRNRSPPPFEPFPNTKSKSREVIQLSPAKVIVQPKFPQNRNSFESNFIDTDLNSTTNRNTFPIRNQRSRNNNIEDTLDKNSRNNNNKSINSTLYNSEAKITSKLNQSKTKNITTSLNPSSSSTFTKINKPDVFIKGQGMDEGEASKIYKDMIAHQHHHSSKHIRTKSFLDEEKSKEGNMKNASTNSNSNRNVSPKGRIRIQTCTYKDNRCLGIDFTQDKSKECVIDETGHWKDSLKI